MQMICLNAKTEQSPDFDCWQCTQKALFWLFLPFLLILDKLVLKRLRAGKPCKTGHFPANQGSHKLLFRMSRQPGRLAWMLFITPINRGISFQRFWYGLTDRQLRTKVKEFRICEEKIRHLPDQITALDPDDGIKFSHARFPDALAAIR